MTEIFYKATVIKEFFDSHRIHKYQVGDRITVVKEDNPSNYGYGKLQFVIGQGAFEDTTEEFVEIKEPLRYANICRSIRHAFNRPFGEMIIKETEVKAFRQDAFCECGGILIRTEWVNLTNPPIYNYVCEKCGNKGTSTTRYPQIVDKECGGK